MPRISAGDYKDLFANLGEIVEIHEDMLAVLEERRSAWDSEASVIGDIFLDRTRFFARYTGARREREGGEAWGGGCW